MIWLPGSAATSSPSSPPAPSDSYSLQATAGRIIVRHCAPYAIRGHEYIIIGASIGISPSSTRRAGDAGDILRYADMALYRAKKEGRNCYRFHSEDLDRQVQERVIIAEELRSLVWSSIRNTTLART